MAVNNSAVSLSSPPQASPAENATQPKDTSFPSTRPIGASDGHCIDEAASQHALPISSSPHNGPAEDTRHQQGQHPPFQPFFTLIQDAQTSEHFHPTVHYIFSDDDTDIVTEAALRSLGTQQDGLPGPNLSRKVSATAHSSEGPVESHKPSLLPPPIPGVHEHYIVLDIEPVSATTGVAEGPRQAIAIPSTAETAGLGSISSSPAKIAPPSASPIPSMSQTKYRITSAKSFSPSWQVLNSELVPAPTFDNHESGEAPEHELMLKILGTEGLPFDAEKDQDERVNSRLEHMMDQFAKRMRELQMVIDAADIAPSPQEKDENGQKSDSAGQQEPTDAHHDSGGEPSLED